MATKDAKGRGRGPAVRGVHRRRGSAQRGELGRGLKPRCLRIDEAKPEPKHHWPDPSRPSAPLNVAAACIDAQWLVVRVPEPLEPLVAIGSGLIIFGPNWVRPKKDARSGRARLHGPSRLGRRIEPMDFDLAGQRPEFGIAGEELAPLLLGQSRRKGIR